jgi:hypothetical protein
MAKKPTKEASLKAIVVVPVLIRNQNEMALKVNLIADHPNCG